MKSNKKMLQFFYIIVDARGNNVEVHFLRKTKWRKLQVKRFRNPRAALIAKLELAANIADMRVSVSWPRAKGEPMGVFYYVRHSHR